MCFLSLYSSLFTILLHLFAAIFLQFIFNNFVIWCKIFAIENLFFNPDTKKLQTCCRNVGFCKKYTKKLQTFYKICVETQKINISIFSAKLLQKHCISIKKICICKDFRHSVYYNAINPWRYCTEATVTLTAIWKWIVS